MDGELRDAAGVRYVKGLRQEIALEIVRSARCGRFASIDDLKLRVPAIAEERSGGAGGNWRAEFYSPAAAADFTGAMRCGRSNEWRGGLGRCWKCGWKSGDRRRHEDRGTCDLHNARRAIPRMRNSPLAPMTAEERLVADFRGTGMTVGPHPMAYHRAELKQQGVRRPSSLQRLPDGTQCAWQDR